MPPPLFGFFFLQKRSLLAKLVLNEHKICLKMLEMAILETQIFENFWTPLESSRLWCSLVPPSFANPGSASGVYSVHASEMFTSIFQNYTETMLGSLVLDSFQLFCI